MSSYIGRSVWWRSARRSLTLPAGAIPRIGCAGVVVLYRREAPVKTAHDKTSSILHTAAWLYVAPRALVGLLFLAALGLAAFLVFGQLALVFLRRLGG